MRTFLRRPPVLLPGFRLGLRRRRREPGCTDPTGAPRGGGRRAGSARTPAARRAAGRLRATGARRAGSAPAVPATHAVLTPGARCPAPAPGTGGPPAAATRLRARRVTRRLRDDRGVSILEFTGFLPILLLIGMATIQLGLIGYGANQAGSGARAAARVASQGGDGAAAGQAAVSGWLDPQVAPAQGADLTTATVTVHVPGVIPLFGGYDLSRKATMPTDD
ncbi:TadE/TadG family type IV pilus assembly protein [Streptomyces sp. NBC_00198]|uniref:TadE/TadG family type IV pilus assembly protein n=1 Tax=Streptomyces sp. NBC_00198 TaxID=2975677 RepID=UPI00225271B5|nr:TadE/TadG family type IV pilus assembly protein [Streptomyces sp. NBC_00198]MCX5278815.1 pilus assembly protein [Streptomyces sp. NBC_00198]